MIKGPEKINMILFGQKKSVSEFLRAMPQLWTPRVWSPPAPCRPHSLPSSAASRERGKVFGLNAVGRSMADKLTLWEVMVRQARRPDGQTDGRGARSPRWRLHCAGCGWPCCAIHSSVH